MACDKRIEISTTAYRQKLDIMINEFTDEVLVFDINGINPGLINAFRRILLSEVPSMAIEKVLIYTNTSMVQDEILSHRLGLIPLKADPRLFQNRLKGREGTDRDTLLFELKVSCKHNPHARFGHKRIQDIYVDSEVYSSSIKWIPLGEQGKLYQEEEIGPIHKDILIAKLKPGLEIEAKLEAIKGIGQDHAKFSPVATASYKLLPYIRFLEDIKGDEAVDLQTCFSPGVIGIQIDIVSGEKTAVILDPRLDFCSRNVFFHPTLKDKVQLGLVTDHYVFTIESAIATKPNDLFKEAVKILREKCLIGVQLIKEIVAKNKKKKYSKK